MMSWIPDFQHRHLPEFFSKDELEFRDRHFQCQLDESDLVIVSSDDAYKDLLKGYSVNKERIGILSFPAIPEKSWYEGDLETALEKYRLPGKYLMFPSQFWAHKNHKALFEAVRILAKEMGLKDLVLVCSGHREDYRNPDHFEKLMTFVRGENLGENIRCLGLIPREDQLLLMRGAGAIVQPSLFEGWCLMVEEARTLGKKIYLSDIGVHREQNPAYATFFNPGDPRELANHIASDWDALLPGIGLEKEKEGYEMTMEKAVKFGRHFMKLIERTIINHQNRKE